MMIKIVTAILILFLAACSPKTDPQAEDADQNYLSALQTSQANTTTFTPAPSHTLTPTYTANPIYTAIFLVATPKNSETPTATLTMTEALTLTPVTSETPIQTASQVPDTTPTTQAGYLPLLGHLFKNVKVYYGAEKTLVFTIIGASESCPIVPSGRGVYVHNTDNQLLWMDRNLLLNSGEYFVRENDPNVYSNQITYLECK